MAGTVNALDLSDADLRGQQISDEAMTKIAAKWSAPMIQAQVGQMWSKIKADPQMDEYYRTNHPDVYAEMEARYANK